MVVTNPSIAQMDDSFATDADLELNGLIVDETVTKLGNDFYQLFYAHDVAGFETEAGWQLDTHVFRYHLATQEIVDVSSDKPAGTNDLHPRFSPNGAYIIFENTSNESDTAKSI